MDRSKHLLLANKAWAKSKMLLDPEFFLNLAKDQQPEFLWIGCSDSRVPTSEITGTDPGEVFVHRNIANQVSPNDPNVQSVIQYAVEALGVKHIIICGHYNCGGVRAALSPVPLDKINAWIQGIKNTLQENSGEIAVLRTEMDRVNQLVELNVLQQMRNLVSLPTIQEAWKKGKPLSLHAWVYNLNDGLLKELKVKTSDN